MWGKPELGMTNAWLWLHHFFHWMDFDWLSCKSRAVVCYIRWIGKDDAALPFSCYQQFKMFLKQPEWFECVIQIKELSQSWLYQYPIIKSEKDNKMLYCTSGLACYQQFKMVEETSHSLCWSQQSGTIGVGVVIIQDSKVLSNLQSSLLSKFPSLDVINN